MDPVFEFLAALSAGLESKPYLHDKRNITKDIYSIIHFNSDTSDNIFHPGK
jgi:hypothetical protein